MTSPVDSTSAMSHNTLLLEVEDLQVLYRIQGKVTPVVKSATFEVGVDEIVGLVGESGSGKSVTALTCLGLTPALGGQIGGGRISINGADVTDAPERTWRRVRGSEVAMVFQQPTRSLNPALTIGAQIAEVARRHRGLGRKEAWDLAAEMLDQVHVPNARQRLHDYPHQFSGGMCQRVAIAMALVGEPKLLIADEPTTALDVTVQRRVLDLLTELKEQNGFSVLLITHDLGVVAERCDRVAVMYAGQVVERAQVEELFVKPRHPYTEGLVNAIPRRGHFGEDLWAIPGQVPPPGAMPTGCRFHPRCPHQREECRSEEVPLVDLGSGRASRCNRTEEVDLKGLD